MVSWYRKFSKDYGEIASPLTQLTKKHTKFECRDEHQRDFVEIKSMLCDAPILLYHPDPEGEYFLHCNASNVGLGNVLTRKVNGIEKVIAFASRQLRKNKQKFSTTERECLAVKFGIEKSRPYIEGGHFTVITDHSALR